MKSPVIVVVAVADDLIKQVEAWRRHRNLWTAKRVFPKGFSNHSPVSGEQLFRHIKGHLEQATKNMGRPEKMIIISDNERFLTKAARAVSLMTYHDPKRFEYHLVTHARNVDPNRVGFFIRGAQQE